MADQMAAMAARGSLWRPWQVRRGRGRGRILLPALWARHASARAGRATRAGQVQPSASGEVQPGAGKSCMAHAVVRLSRRHVLPSRGETTVAEPCWPAPVVDSAYQPGQSFDLGIRPQVICWQDAQFLTRPEWTSYSARPPSHAPSPGPKWAAGRRPLTCAARHARHVQKGEAGGRRICKAAGLLQPPSGEAGLPWRDIDSVGGGGALTRRPRTTSNTSFAVVTSPAARFSVPS